MGLLRVEFFHDDEAGSWHYRVPALHINGGGTVTREDAKRDCLAAIHFALQTGDGAIVNSCTWEYVDVQYDS